MNVVMFNERVKKQVVLLCYAFSFFSRMPISKRIDFKAYPFHLGNCYFPIVGLCAASLGFVIYCGASYLFDDLIAVFMMLIVGILFTGAFHEDGFADCCDGFGGGYDKDQRLRIMKDSQIGTYGAVGLILLLGGKFYLYYQVLKNPLNIAFVMFIFAAMYSRFSTLLILQFSDYARDNESAKSSLVSYRLPIKYLLGAALLSLWPLLLLPFSWAVVCVAAVAISTYCCQRYFSSQLGGYTGDCLGFTQQINELLILLLFSSLVTWLPMLVR